MQNVAANATSGELIGTAMLQYYHHCEN